MQITELAKDGIQAVRQAFSRDERKGNGRGEETRNGHAIAKLPAGGEGTLAFDGDELVSDLRPEGEAVSGDALDLLVRQHREVEALFTELEQAGPKAQKSRSRLVEMLLEKIQAHMRLEERLFYPQAMDVDEGQVREAIEEHETLKASAKRLRGTEPGHDSFMARVTVLKEIFQNHIRQEENELFPKVRREYGEQRLRALSERMNRQLRKTANGRTKTVHKKKKTARLRRKKTKTMRH